VTFSDQFLTEVSDITTRIDTDKIELAVEMLAATKKNKGRLFILGIGGSAANASHAVNDFRKIAKIETYSPTDNVAEFSARINDEHWNQTFVRFLETSQLKIYDTVLVLSGSGGNVFKKKSMNLIPALEYANERKAYIIGILGGDGGYTAGAADVAIIIPTVNPQHLYQHAESFQSVIWHLMVSHPALASPSRRSDSDSHTEPHPPTGA
jgi:D-sedoheptulose 7-phosphate isomerase